MPESPTPSTALAVNGDYLLPNYRILSFYGFPGEVNMGMLGEYDMQTLLERLRGAGRRV